MGHFSTAGCISAVADYNRERRIVDRSNIIVETSSSRWWLWLGLPGRIRLFITHVQVLLSDLFSITSYAVDSLEERLLCDTQQCRSLSMITLLFQNVNQLKLLLHQHN
jgi:hypothetical protein